jgi:DNA modification methylase
MMQTPTDAYVTEETRGDAWEMWLGDSCERMAEIPDCSIDLSVCSPPFAQLYNYSPSPRDLSNSADRAEFFKHYRFIIDQQLRVTKPGRIAAVHVQQITLQKVMHGYVGLTDFRGQVIREYEDAGWIFWGETTVWKDPQEQAIRTKASTLLFVTLKRNRLEVRPGLADYLLLFKKPGEAEVPLPTRDNEVTQEDWIKWASPVWTDIKQGNTLNVRVAKDDADERHIAPLQLEFIERVVRLYSQPGETVFSPFGGIGSEPYTAVRLGRRGFAIELKPSYYRTAVDNLQALERQLAHPTLPDPA